MAVNHFIEWQKGTIQLKLPNFNRSIPVTGNVRYTHWLKTMRKPTICIYENKDAGQLRGNREADQRLCFRYIDRMFPLLSKSEISSL